MPVKNNDSLYDCLGKITASLLTAASVFIILTAFYKEEPVSYEKLRKAYDGLSPRDYQ